MYSYWGLDWKTGATRRIRPLRREETVLSSSLREIAKLRSSKHSPRPLGSKTDLSSNSNRRLIATGAGVTLFFRFPFAGLLTLELVLGICGRKWTDAKTPYLRLRQYLRSEHLVDLRTLQQQKTRH